MRRKIKRAMALMLSVMITFSMVSVNSFKINAGEILEAEETSTEETMIEESTDAETKDQEQPTETVMEPEIETESETETGSEDNDTETESTSEEQEIATGDYDIIRQEIVNQINDIPKADADDYMEKVVALYINYSKLPEDEVEQFDMDILRKYEEILETAGDMNHKDSVTGIEVEADSLPWYVKVVAEKTDENEFQKKYENYLDTLYENDDLEDDDWDADDNEDWDDDDGDNWDDDDDSDDDDWDDEDDEDSDYEDEDISDDDNDNEDWDYENGADDSDEDDEDFYPSYFSYTRLGYRADNEKMGQMASAHKISLYDIIQDKKYDLPEGMKVKVKLPYIKEYIGYALEVIHLKDDNSYESIRPHLLDKISGERVGYTKYYDFYDAVSAFLHETGRDGQNKDDKEGYYDDGDGDDEDDDWDDDDDWNDDEDDEDEDDWDDDEDDRDDEEDDWDEEAFIKWVEEENSKIRVEDYSVAFETESFSEFAVMLTEDVYINASETAGKGAKYKNAKPDTIKKSPKTGHGLAVPVAVALSSGMVAIIGVAFYRKKEEDIV